MQYKHQVSCIMKGSFFEKAILSCFLFLNNKNQMKNKYASWNRMHKSHSNNGIGTIS